MTTCPQLDSTGLRVIVSNENHNEVMSSENSLYKFTAMHCLEISFPFMSLALTWMWKEGTFPLNSEVSKLIPEITIGDAEIRSIPPVKMIQFESPSSECDFICNKRFPHEL
jgi:hypothetical protein